MTDKEIDWDASEARERMIDECRKKKAREQDSTS
jgi:hypothetical protein